MIHDEAKLNRIKEDFLKDLNSNLTPEELKIKYLGKKSVLNSILKSLNKLPLEDRKKIGKLANDFKIFITDKINQISKKEINTKSTKIDFSEPSSRRYIGRIHPIIQIIDEVIEIFGQYGFEYAEGPEIETDWYCFESLNMPPEHPARDMQDTFYLDKEMHILPRTHTSAVQVRYGEKHKPPFRIVVPGRVYRNEAVDARHTFMFHQFEALIVDDTTTVTDCKNIITNITRYLLRNDKLEVRFRHAFFPYTEPSFEIDGTCLNCLGKGCNICSNKGWVELGGLGMVHPQVLRNMNIDPDKYQGFALGFGPERFAMLRHGVKYLPEFFENDLRFLRQF